MRPDPKWRQYPSDRVSNLEGAALWLLAAAVAAVFVLIVVVGSIAYLA